MSANGHRHDAIPLSSSKKNHGPYKIGLRFVLIVCSFEIIINGISKWMLTYCDFSENSMTQERDTKSRNQSINRENREVTILHSDQCLPTTVTKSMYFCLSVFGITYYKNGPLLLGCYWRFSCYWRLMEWYSEQIWPLLPFPCESHKQDTSWREKNMMCLLRTPKNGAWRMAHGIR